MDQWEKRDVGEQLDVIFYFMWNICTFCEGDGDFLFSWSRLMVMMAQEFKARRKTKYLQKVLKNLT